MFEITQPLRWQVASRGMAPARTMLAGAELGTHATPPQGARCCRALAGFDSSSSLGATDESGIASPSRPPLRQAEQRATPGLRRALAGGRSPERGLGMAELPEDGAVLMEVG